MLYPEGVIECLSEECKLSRWKFFMYRKEKLTRVRVSHG